jgi:hypothetical protein
MSVEVTFHFNTINITTIVYVDNLEVEANIRAKAVAQASAYIAQEYGIDVDDIGYLSVSTNIEAIV